jgi:hypothetical protein
LAIPRSTLAQWVGACGVQLQPLVDALKQELLRHSVLHADETPVAMFKPSAWIRPSAVPGPTTCSSTRSTTAAATWSNPRISA